MFSNIGITAAVFFLPLLLKQRGIDDIQIAILAMSYSIALFISSSIFGRLNDSYGRRPFLLIGLVTSALTTMLYIFPESFTMFTLTRILNGISIGIFPAAIMAIASDRKYSMGKLSSWRAAGWASGSIINGVTAEFLQLEAAFVLSTLLFGVSYAIAYIRDTGGLVDTSIHQFTTNIDVKPNYFTVLKHNWQVYLLVILRHGSGASIWVYWTLFLQADLSLNTFQIGTVLAVNTITQTVVMRYFGDLGDSRTMFLVGTFLSSIAFLSFPFARNYLEILLTQLLLGVSFSFFLVGGLRTAEARGSQLQMVGTATGLFEASFSISQVIGPLLAIVIFSQYQTYTDVMTIAGIITLVSSLLYGIFLKNKPIHIDKKPMNT